MSDPAFAQFDPMANIREIRTPLSSPFRGLLHPEQEDDREQPEERSDKFKLQSELRERTQHGVD